MTNIRTPQRRPGIAAVEVALFLPVLAGLLFLLVEGVTVLKTYAALSEASRSAARQVIVSGETSGAPDLVKTLVPDLDAGSLTTSVNMDSTGSSVTVEVSYDYSSFFAKNPVDGSDTPLLTLVASTSMPVP